jgi:hypothetical protein
MRNQLKSILIGCSMLSLSGVANALTIAYETTNISGNRWAYSYAVNTDANDITVEAFSVYFNPTDYENLSNPSAPMGWDPLIAPPNPYIPDDGYYDVASTVGGIEPGNWLGGFSVEFDYLGLGVPGAQHFDILDLTTLTVLDSGTTQPSDTQVVPVPSAILLFVAGLAGLIGTSRKSEV